MDTRQLKTLVAIATHRTFAQAADVVSLSPSAVSQQMRALEQELDATLFDRASRPPKLTPQGIQVFDLAQNILRMEDDTIASLRGDQIAGTLMLGSVRSSALHLLPRAIMRMHAQYPNLKTNLKVSVSSTLITDVASGRLDAAVVVEHVGVPPALRWSPFLREPLWLIAPIGSECSGTINMLRTQPYIRFQSAVPLAILIDTEIARTGTVTNDVAEIDNVAAIVTCVREGMGISVVPNSALQEPEDDQLMRIPFGEPQLMRQVGLVERTLSPRREIIARLHAVLAEDCGNFGVQRAEN